MFHSKLSGKLIEPNSPENLILLTNSETIGIGEDVSDTNEGFAEVRFKVGVSFENCDAGDGSQVFGFVRGSIAGDDTNSVFAICCESCWLLDYERK
jgi:hypothetical protein